MRLSFDVLTLACLFYTRNRAAWKYQICSWAEAGYRVVAPDMLGYGQTDKPDGPEEYSLKRLSDDLAALLDHIGSSKAVRSTIPIVNNVNR